MKQAACFFVSKFQRAAAWWCVESGEPMEGNGVRKRGRRGGGGMGRERTGRKGAQPASQPRSQPSPAQRRPAGTSTVQRSSASGMARHTAGALPGKARNANRESGSGIFKTLSRATWWHRTSPRPATAPHGYGSATGGSREPPLYGDTPSCRSLMHCPVQSNHIRSLCEAKVPRHDEDEVSLL